LSNEEAGSRSHSDVFKDERRSYFTSDSEELSITKEGARKHLLNLAEEGLIEPTMKSEGVGRPSTYYTLTDKGLAQFPDTHAEVTVQLLQSVKNLLGENALDLLISDREKNTYERYQKALSKTKTLEQRLQVLAEARSKEGYMAEWKKKEKNIS
jgi:predicted ArsR family transcriptional regulator